MAGETENPNTPRRAEDATDGSAAGALSIFMRHIMRSLRVCMPVKVTGYDRRTHRVVVEELCLGRTVDGQTFQPNVFACTAWHWRTGGFLIDLPIKVGTTGWVIVPDEDTRSMVRAASRKAETPATMCIHSPDCGFFIPDWWGENDGSGDTELYEDVGNKFVIGSADGKQRIEISHSDIVVKCSEFKVDAKSIVLKSEGQVDIEAPQTMVEGNLQVENAATGNVTNFNTATVVNGIVTGII